MPALRILHFVIVFVIVSISTGTGKTGVLFTSEKRLRQKKYIVPYWGIEVVPVLTERRKRTDRSKVRTKIDRGPIFPVRLEQSRLVSTLFYGTRAKLVLTTKSIQLMTVSMETLRMVKSRPRENQSKASDFPQDYLDNIINPSMYIPSVIYNS